jgi:hypothetical protein
MASSARMNERVAGGKRGEFLFIVHVVAPDGGFGHSPAAANPLNRRGGDSNADGSLNASPGGSFAAGARRVWRLPNRSDIALAGKSFQ